MAYESSPSLSLHPVLHVMVPPAMHAIFREMQHAVTDARRCLPLADDQHGHVCEARWQYTARSDPADPCTSGASAPCSCPSGNAFRTTGEPSSDSELELAFHRPGQRPDPENIHEPHPRSVPSDQLHDGAQGAPGRTAGQDAIGVVYRTQQVHSLPGGGKADVRHVEKAFAAHPRRLVGICGRRCPSLPWMFLSGAWLHPERHKSAHRP